MNRKKDKSKLTEAEFELMSVLWQLGEASVSEVIAAAASDKEMAYTSAATILGILEDKAFLGSRKEGKARLFFPVVSKTQYESRSINKMLSKLFNNTPVAMVARLVEEDSVSDKELRAMKKLLDERLKK